MTGWSNRLPRRPKGGWEQEGPSHVKRIKLKSVYVPEKLPK